jgi:signal transduction histidine kinase
MPACMGWTARALIEHGELITDRWEAALRARVEGLRPLQQAIVRDHIFDFLRALASWVEEGEGGPELEAFARSHGVQRVSHGVLLRELVHEQRLLRETITAVLDDLEPHADPAPAEVARRRCERARLHEALDRVVDQAVERYASVRADAISTLQARLQMAIEAAGIGTWDHDPALSHLEIDDRARRLFGLPDEPRPFHLEELMGRVEAICRPKLLAALSAAVEPGDHELRLELMTTGPGGERWLRLEGRALADASGVGVRVLGTVSDVTQQRHLERTRDRFLAVLGHDLRSPLNAIGMAAHLVKGGCAPAQGDAIAERMHRSVRRMEGLIRDLLDFTRAAIGTSLPLVLHRTRIEAIAHKVLDEVAAGHPEATLIHAGSGECEGAWDAERLEQVITNLLTNAIKYGRPGSPIELRWTEEPTCDGDRWVVLEVHNEGDPIPPELVPHLFEAFRMGPAAATTGQPSAGLGLYIVAQIVRAHGGEVSVTSTAEAGTTFRVRLPPHAA